MLAVQGAGFVVCEIISPGTQRSPFAHVPSSSPRSSRAAAGTIASGTHFPFALQHVLNVVGGFFGASQLTVEQTPVAAPVVGSKHGTQRSFASQPAAGRRSFCCATGGRLTFMQRPSAFAT